MTVSYRRHVSDVNSQRVSLAQRCLPMTRSSNRLKRKHLTRRHQTDHIHQLRQNRQLRLVKRCRWILLSLSPVPRRCEEKRTQSCLHWHSVKMWDIWSSLGRNYFKHHDHCDQSILNHSVPLQALKVENRARGCYETKSSWSPIVEEWNRLEIDSYCVNGSHIDLCAVLREGCQHSSTTLEKWRDCKRRGERTAI